MRTYNVIIIGPQHETVDLKLGNFQFQQLNEVNVQTDDFKECCHILIDADIVVTLNNWQSDKDSSGLLAIARIMGKEVVPHTNFEKYVQQLND